MQFGVERLVLLRYPVPIFLNVGRIDHQHIAIFGQAIHQHIIHNAALGIHQATVLHLADEQFARIVAADVLHQRTCPATPNDELAHVRHIKHTHIATDTEVFFGDAAVRNGHFVTRKRADFCL